MLISMMKSTNISKFIEILVLLKVNDLILLFNKNSGETIDLYKCIFYKCAKAIS